MGGDTIQCPVPPPDKLLAVTVKNKEKTDIKLLWACHILLYFVLFAKYFIHD